MAFVGLVTSPLPYGNTSQHSETALIFHEFNAVYFFEIKLLQVANVITAKYIGLAALPPAPSPPVRCLARHQCSAAQRSPRMASQTVSTAREMACMERHKVGSSIPTPCGSKQTQQRSVPLSRHVPYLSVRPLSAKDPPPIETKTYTIIDLMSFRHTDSPNLRIAPQRRPFALAALQCRPVAPLGAARAAASAAPRCGAVRYFPQGLGGAFVNGLGHVGHRTCLVWVSLGV